MAYFVVIPAYGRKYKNKQEVERDFESGKDFRIAVTGQYMSIRDLKKTDIVEIHYSGKVTIMKAGE